MSADIRLLTTKCPECFGRCYQLSGLGVPETCVLCDALGVVTPKEKADWEREQKAKTMKARGT